ncbi:glycosyltransferase family 4 protein [Flavobacterium chungnamense]|uniref:Glycosyltransferase family 4 protein n=1 Tax=Flavobacterium chungnamense TaxID=706182 RepID=A0ABP7UVW3_9FLAO
MKSKKLIVGITAEGSVNLLLGQLAYFKSLGYETYLLAPYSERSANFCKKEGCTHLIINIEREISLWKDLKTLLKIIRIFKEVKPDIINLGTPKVALLGMIAGKILGIKNRIYTCRGFRFEHENGVKRKILIAMEKITSLCAHQVICISDSVQKLGIAADIFSKKKSNVINKGSSNGVNLELFDPLNQTYIDKKQEIVDKYDLKDKFVYGFLGRIVDRKGINELYNVFCKIYEENSNTRLLLVGPFETDQIADKTLLEKINNHPAIFNIGRVLQDEVPPYILALDVFVLPAWWEGFGNVLVQAAAMGIPVISTTGTGTIDAVSDNFNGILVNPKAEMELEFAMKHLLLNKEITIQYGENGLEWSRNFERTIIWNGINQLYTKR